MLVSRAYTRNERRLESALEQINGSNGPIEIDQRALLGAAGSFGLADETRYVIPCCIEVCLGCGSGCVVWVWHVRRV